jgi:hypothetical protein
MLQNTGRIKRLNEHYIPDDPTVIKHVDEVLKLLSVMTCDDKYEIQINNADNGGVSMCTVAQNLENIGIQKGEQIGENKLASLISKMIADNKSDDIIKVTNDEGIRQDY